MNILYPPNYFMSIILFILCCIVGGDQKVSVHLTITVQSSGAERLFDHSVFI